VIVRFVDIGGIVDHRCLNETLNSDGQLFHQYQQNEQSPLKRKLKQ
jgi:hypothetical protein